MVLNAQLHTLLFFQLCHPKSEPCIIPFRSQKQLFCHRGTRLDKYPNLYADISARYAETASIPRFMRMFYIQHQNRLLYGTDMGFEESMYKITFRILETEDEHFYETERFRYHWALNGFDLPNSVLRKLYKENALKVLNGK